MKIYHKVRGTSIVVRENTFLVMSHQQEYTLEYTSNEFHDWMIAKYGDSRETQRRIAEIEQLIAGSVVYIGE